jgi:polyisoprenoid-binding protein YceI
MRVRKGISLVTLVAAAFPLAAQERVFELDPAQTHITFTLGSTLHTVHGIFQMRSGTVHFYPDTGKASGELIVDAASGDSGNHSRDRRMHQSILESQKFPDIVFRPSRIEGKLPPQGPATLQVYGIFAIHGGQHELTVPANVQVEPNRIDAVLHFAIPYVQWGMKNPSNLLLHVNDKADIEVHTVFHLEPGI